MDTKNTFTNNLSKEIWEITYKGPDDNTPQDTFERVAKAASSVENKDKKEEVYKNFQWLLSDFKFLPGSRTVANLGIEGREGTTLYNCFVHHPKDIGLKDCDSIVGIYEMLKCQALTLKTEGGYGINASWIRPKGCYISGIGVRTPGVLRFMELWDKSSEIITAGSEYSIDKKRKNEKIKIHKGAQMLVLNCWHPEIEDFIVAKQTPNRLTKFNISVGITSGFMKSVENDKDWDLIFPDTAFEKYKEEWNGDIEEWEEKKYPIIKYKTVKAKDLWDKMLKCTYNRAEPGILFLELANKLNPLYYGEKIYTTNPCVTGDTKILIKGKKHSKNARIDKLVGKEIKVWNGQEWSDTEVVITGYDKPILKIKTNTGKFLKCTYEHSFILENEDRVSARNLRIGDKLLSTKEIKSGTVTSIENAGNVKTVYCFTEPKLHRGVFNGILTGQCGEIPMSTGVCNLGSINLAKCIKYDKKPEFDFELFSQIVKHGIRFLDNINDISRTPLPEYLKAVKEKRRIGLGVFGLGSLFFILGIRFGSEESLTLIKKIFKFKSEQEILSSAEIGKEKGNFLLFNKDKYFSSYWWKHLKISQDIKERVEKIGCMRNSHRSMNAPTGNTSIFANNPSGGIEPVFMKEYLRWVIVNERERDELRNAGFKFCNFSEGEWKETEHMKFSLRGDEEILKGTFNERDYEIDKNRGLTRSNLVEDYGWKIAKEIYGDKLEKMGKEGIFVTTKDLDVNDHINTLSIISHYTDQANSKTVNIPNNYSFENFQKVYLDAWNNGIKGITTYREGIMTVVLESKDKEVGIKENNAPKRPKSLKCDIHFSVADKEQYYVIVGKMNSPYEIFVGLNHYRGNTIIPVHLKEGELLKENKGKYYLLSGDHKILLTNSHSNFNCDALTRLISANLRHGTPLPFITEQLLKNDGDMFIFSKVIARILKKYIKDGTKGGGVCPECGSKELIYKDGCVSCSCSWSKCN